MKALVWLAKVQKPDGSWGDSKKVSQALTGLALLTFLAHGETPQSKQFGTTVKKAIQWLAEAPMDTKSSHAYPHAIRAYALAEAYSMTGISAIEGPMLECMDIILKGQQEGGCFDYKYAKGKRQDLSLAGWNYQAMKAAYGTGLDIPGLEDGIYKAIAWLKKMGGGGSFPYSTKGNKVTGKGGGDGKHSMRAVGVLCLQLFNEGNTPEITDELQAISTKDLDNLNWEKPPVQALYGWYYATQCMFQKGGDMWKSWNRKFQAVLNANQHGEGYWEHPKKVHGPEGLDSKIYATTLCALQLTVYYRYLPSSGKGGGFAEKVKEHKNVLKKNQQNRKETEKQNKAGRNKKEVIVEEDEELDLL